MYETTNQNQPEPQRQHYADRKTQEQKKRRMVMIAAVFAVIALAVVGVLLLSRPAENDTLDDVAPAVQQSGDSGQQSNDLQPEQTSDPQAEDKEEAVPTAQIDMDIYNSMVVGQTLEVGDYKVRCEPDLTCTITKYTGSASDLEIPATLNASDGMLPLRVTAIGEHAFSYSKTLKTVTIPEGVVTIGNSAFSTCRSLEKVTLPRTLTSIGNKAFMECVLRSVTIPADVAEVGEQAFQQNKPLSRVTFEGSWTRIAASAFYYCQNLQIVRLPAELTTIEAYTFYGCQGLSNIEIPVSVTSIGDEAFYIAGLGRLLIPESVISIGKGAFAGCKSLCIVAPADSYAYQYALDNRIAVDEP